MEATVEAQRKETVEFIRKYGLQVCRISSAKKPYENDWNKPEFYEPERENILRGFINGNWMIGIITGVKCANGLYLAVVDVDSKKFYEKVMQPYDNQTTVVQSGGLKKWGGKKEVSLHYYFFVRSPFKTFRKHDKSFELEVDLQCLGVQVVAPGSLHPDTGKPYVFLNDMPPMIWNGDLLSDLKQMVAKAFKIKLEAEAVNVSKLLEGPVEKGNRDTAAFQLATYFRTKGMTEEEVKLILYKWRAEKCVPNDDDFTDATIDEKIKSAFSPEEPYKIKFIEEETFSDVDQKEVNRLLENPELIPRYIFEATAEVVHEEKNRVIIVVLIFADESLEISGKSSGGKSRLADACCRCFSLTMKDGVIRKVTSISPKALRHMKTVPHTWYIAERTGMDKSIDETSVEYDIKVGISEHEITATFVDKQTGETIEQTIPFHNAVFTTTEIAQSAELGNRIYNLSVDDSKQQNSDVVDFKLDQLAKFPGERVNTDDKKKVLRCLFKQMRELNLQNDQFIIPWARLLKRLLPSNETAIRRHTDKLTGAILAFAKLMHRKLPMIEENGKTFYIVPPEVFWYVFSVGDEAIFMQIVGMNKTQTRYWNMMLELFGKQHGLGVSIKDVAAKTKRARGTISKLFDFYEENGLISTRSENREKFADLTIGDGERWENENQQLALADLREEFENWLINHHCVVAQDHKLSLLDPFTGVEVQGKDTDIKFGLNFNPVKITEPNERCVQKNQQSPNNSSLEDMLKGQ